VVDDGSRSADDIRPLTLDDRRDARRPRAREAFGDRGEWLIVVRGEQRLEKHPE
jgi:hypothetical protein